MRILAIVNQKGGVGKTTTAINVSVALARRRKRVVLVDLDAQANSTEVLLAGPAEKNVLHIFREKLSASAVLTDTGIPNLRLLPATTDLIGLDLEIVNRPGREDILKRSFAGFTDADYIILDTPPNLSIITLNALNFADSFIIPVNMCKLAMLAINDLLGTVQEVNEAIRSEDLEFIGIVPTLCENTNSTRHGIDLLRQEYGSGRVLPHISRSVRLVEAHQAGKSILDFAPNHKTAVQYDLLAQALIKHDAKPAKGRAKAKVANH